MYILVLFLLIKKGGVSQISIFNTYTTTHKIASRHALLSPSPCLDRIVTEVVNDAPLNRSRSRYMNERSKILDDT